MALLSRFVVDSALGGSGQLAFWGGLLILNVLVLVGFHGLLSWMTGSTMDTMTVRLRAQLVRSAAYSTDLRLQQFHSGQLLSRGMEDVLALCDGLVSALPSLVGQISKLLAAFAAVLFISPGVALVMAAATIFIVLATALLRPVLKKHHRIVRSHDEQVTAAISEDLQQLELIQSLQMQEKVLRQLHGVQANSLRARRRRRLWSVGISSIMNVGILIGSGVLLLWGALQVAHNKISYGSLTSMLQLFALFQGPMLGISGLWTRFAGVEVAGERLADLFKVVTPEQIQEGHSPVAVVFENVTFCYPGEDTPVIQNFSAVFPMEQWACLTGISGKGKTTLFKLMLALYAPQSGSVLIRTPEGDIPCTEATRHLFAYVPQDYGLFSGTIMENLHLVGDPDLQCIKAALTAAQADFVWSLPAGLQTPVLENNAGLSKGQLQRLAIARAILMERPIFLLDECTSALDAETEAAVLRGLYSLGKKAVVVTHRPNAMKELPDIRWVHMQK